MTRSISYRLVRSWLHVRDRGLKTQLIKREKLLSGKQVASSKPDEKEKETPIISEYLKGKNWMRFVRKQQSLYSNNAPRDKQEKDWFLLIKWSSAAAQWGNIESASDKLKYERKKKIRGS